MDWIVCSLLDQCVSLEHNYYYVENLPIGLYVGGVFDKNGGDFVTMVTNTVWCALKMREMFEKSSFSLIPSLAIHSGELIVNIITAFDEKQRDF